MTLDEVCDRLERALADAERNLERQLAVWRADPAPVARTYDTLTAYDMRDNNGRYVLLDALASLAQAKAASRG